MPYDDQELAAGRIIEQVPWDWRHDRSRAVLVKLGIITDDDAGTKAEEFLIGVFVHAHARRISDTDPAALRELAESLIAEAARIESANCTGLAAFWCPVHGDCACPEPDISLDDDDCPLHSRHSPHGY